MATGSTQEELQLRRESYPKFMMTSYDRYVTQRVLQVRRARSTFTLNPRLKGLGHDELQLNGK